MTKQEQKDLLLKDLCARLPYGIMANYKNNIYVINEIDPACKDIDYITVRIQDTESLMCAESVMMENVKPYLRPMSSMTEKEKEELQNVLISNPISPYGELTNKCDNLTLHCAYGSFLVMSYLYSRHFDVLGLIPMGLAIEVTEENNPYERI